MIVVFVIALVIAAGAGMVFLLLRAAKSSQLIATNSGDPAAQEATGSSKPLEPKTANDKDPLPMPAAKSIPEWARSVSGISQDSIPQKQNKGLFGFSRNLGTWFRFSVKGKEQGFHFAELQVLYRTAQIMGIHNIESLLWSSRALDACMKVLLWQNVRDGTLEKSENEDFLFRLMRYRQGMEVGRHRSKSGLMSTRSMSIGQQLKIVIPHVGLYQSKVLLITRTHLEISLPQGKTLPGGFSWSNQKVEIYFWRKEDAGYFFESVTSGRPDKSMSPILQIPHSESLIRTQKRMSVRAKVRQDAWLSPLRSPADASEQFKEGEGYLCRLLDISDSGAAILVRGQLEAGFYIKIQTVLGGFPLAMCGEIKACNVHREKKISVLHIEAIPLSKTSRLRILSYALGLTRQPENAQQEVRGEGAAIERLDQDVSLPAIGENS